MSLSDPTFFNRLLVITFAAGVVALGAEEVHRRGGGFTSAHFRTRGKALTQAARPAEQRDRAMLAPRFSEPSFLERFFGQNNTPLEGAERAPNKNGKPAAAPEVVREDTDVLTRSDRKQLDSLIDELVP